MKFRFYHAGETVMNFGDPGNEFFIIMKGEVSVLVPRKVKHEAKDHHKLNFFKKLDISLSTK